MTIALYHLDSDFVGHPNWSLSSSPSSRQFLRHPGEKGSGQYRELNPLAPQQVSLSWDFTDEQYNFFLLAWNSANNLMWGANWFTMDLPLMLDFTAPITMGELVWLRKRFALNVGELGGTTLGYNIWNANFGSVEPQRAWGDQISLMQYIGPVGTQYVSTLNGNQINGASQIRLYWNAPGDEGLYSTLNWIGASNYYFIADAASDQPNAESWLQSNLNQDIGVDIEFQSYRFQRYRCHFTATYSASHLGYNHWRVDADMEVDLTQEFAAA